jgi:hypothetical protein
MTVSNQELKTYPSGTAVDEGPFVFMNVNLSPSGCDFNLSLWVNSNVLVGILTIGGVGVDALRRVKLHVLIT